MYSEKVIDHYNNPRNVGSLDKTSSDVGTGLVGAPECFIGSTLIATADGSNCKSLEEIYLSGKPIPVWSFNISKKIFEIKLAQAVYSGEKQVDKIILDDYSSLTGTPDHEFLTRPFYQYIANNNIDQESIRPFKRYVNKRGYWRVRDSKNYDQYREIFKFYYKILSLAGLNIHYIDENNEFHKIKNRVPAGVFPTFTLQVEENNNYVVLTKITKNTHSGVVVKNCGDVMKLQIKVNKETNVIEDAKFKTFGCGSAIASSSLATEWVKGRTIDEALSIQNMEIVKELALPPVKIHCSVLAEDAIRAAVADWKKKQV
jgi:nitrogen fixation NifU-like protein